MIISPDGSGGLVRTCHVTLSRHTIKNAPTAEDGAGIIERAIRSIQASYSWAESPPADVSTSELEFVLDSYFALKTIAEEPKP